MGTRVFLSGLIIINHGNVLFSLKAPVLTIYPFDNCGSVSGDEQATFLFLEPQDFAKDASEGQSSGQSGAAPASGSIDPFCGILPA